MQAIKAIYHETNFKPIQLIADTCKKKYEVVITFIEPTKKHTKSE